MVASVRCLVSRHSAQWSTVISLKYSSVFPLFSTLDIHEKLCHYYCCLYVHLEAARTLYALDGCRADAVALTPAQ